MIFSHDYKSLSDSSFKIGKDVSAVAHACLCKDIFSELWKGFTFHLSTITLSEGDSLTFRIGDAAVPSLSEGEYAISVEETGVCIVADTETALVRGFMTFLDLVTPPDELSGAAAEVKCCAIEESPTMENRMVHYCVFPQTELWELDRFIRLCGALKYTHIVIEFWGMLKYDCMKELSWSMAFTKDQVRPLMDMARDLGLEVIPMFNHWGHASAGRVMHGKHVVLDQDPTKQTYFSEDGWCWDISKEKVKKLLASIRRELCELCGEGKYFHIGCDEAYNFPFTKENMDFICDYINEISGEMKELGRRAIIWGDMFLYRYTTYNPNNRYSCNCPTPEDESYMLSRLTRDVMIADWQYNVKEAPVETSSVFVNAGFDCLVCPWDRGDAQLVSCIATARSEGMKGIMHTTWHTLTQGMPYVVIAAKGGFDSVSGYGLKVARVHTAALLRKVYPVSGDYKKAGWASDEIGVIV